SRMRWELSPALPSLWRAGGREHPTNRQGPPIDEEGVGGYDGLSILTDRSVRGVTGACRPESLGVLHALMPTHSGGDGRYGTAFGDGRPPLDQLLPLCRLRVLRPESSFRSPRILIPSAQ